MKYLLKNKDRAILGFDMTNEKRVRLGEEDIENIVTGVEVYDGDYLPYGLEVDNISKWIKNRKVPKNRQFVEKIIDSYNMRNGADRVMDYIDISFGLSLNDSFWITPADKDYKWADYNLYVNSFNEALALVAFSGESHKIHGIVTSPEYTTNGMLAKCWHRDGEGDIFLYKGSSQEYANGGKEAFGEFYCYQVAKILGFNAVEYDLCQFQNKIVSSCRAFTNENEGYIPIYHFLGDYALNHLDEKSIEEISSVYGKEAFEDMMVFDAIVGNEDRHLGNYGMIVDNNSGQILRPAPIFDNGLSALNLFTIDDFKQIDSVIQKRKSQLNIGFNTQLQYFIKERHADGLSRLANFSIQKHEKYNLDGDWLDGFESFIRDRANLGLRLLNKEMVVIDGIAHDPNDSRAMDNFRELHTADRAIKEDKIISTSDSAMINASKQK